MFEGFRSQVMTVNGVGIQMRTKGSGAPVVLLHGYPQSGTCWHKVAPTLAEGYSVVVPDLRGYGASEKPADDKAHTVYSKRTMALDVVQLMAALGHDRFAVVGHDRGGRVAYRLALDHPEVVTKLCTLDIVPTLDQFESLSSSRAAAIAGFHWYFLAQRAPLPERLVGSDPAFYLSELMGRWAGPGGAITTEAMAAYVDAFTPETIAATCADYRAGATIDCELDLADRTAGRMIRCPVHALWGDRRSEPANDALLQTWRRWTAADQPVTGRPVPGGHFIAEELPDLLVEELRFFL